MTRVLFLTESFHPVLGGGETHIRLLASRLSAHGYGTIVVTRRGERGWPLEESLDGIRVVRVPPSGQGRWGKYLMVGGALLRLARLRRDYDLVVVRGSRVLGPPGVLLARALGRKVIVQPEVTGELSGEIYTWGTRLDRPSVKAALKAPLLLRQLALFRAHAFVAISDRIGREMRDAGVPEGRVHVIPHGVDTKRFAPRGEADRGALRSRLGLDPLAPLAVFTGRLLRGKGLEVLLQALEAVLQREPRLVLALVGAGGSEALSVEAELKRTVERRGLFGHVLFTGRVTNVEDYLAAADLFVFPSLFEAMPLSVLEAASAGAPIVATDVGGIPEVIQDGRSGLLVPKGDPRLLAEAMGALLRDREKAASLGRAARGRILAHFDLELSLARYEALFDAVASPSAPKAG